MRLIERYVLARTLRGFLATIGGLSATIWLFQFLSELDVVTSKGQTIWTFFVMTVLALPAIIQAVIAFAFLVGIILALNGLNADGELAAVAGAGASRTCTHRPILLLSVALMALLVASYHVVAPSSLSGLRTMLTRIRADVIAKFVQDGNFRTLDGGVTLHIREKMPDGSFRGIFLSDARQDGNTTQFIAERGLLMEQDFRTFLLLENGSIVHTAVEPGSERPARDSVVTFNSYALDLGQFGSTAAAAAKNRISERTTPNLLAATSGNARVSDNAATIAAEVHTRLSEPLFAPGFALICLGLLGKVRSRRGGTAGATIAAIAICIALRMLSFGVAAAVPDNPSLALCLYAVPLATIAIGLILVAKPTPVGPRQRTDRSLALHQFPTTIRRAASA